MPHLYRINKIISNIFLCVLQAVSSIFERIEKTNCAILIPLLVINIESLMYPNESEYMRLSSDTKLSVVLTIN